MLINEVQYKVGLTKKSIRYYEAEGLLNPKRNSGNDYREYNEDDLKELKLIKFLRELGVSIHDIKELKRGVLSLKDCMNDRIKKLEETERSFRKIKNMCNEIADSNINYNDIDITKYSEEMNILNKRGVTMRDVKKSDHKKILGACLSSFLFSLIFLFLIGLMLVIAITEDSFPFPLFFLFLVIFGLPVLGIVINLVKRVKEIRGGEENEASKY